MLQHILGIRQDHPSNPGEFEGMLPHSDYGFPGGRNQFWNLAQDIVGLSGSSLARRKAYRATVRRQTTALANKADMIATDIAINPGTHGYGGRFSSAYQTKGQTDRFLRGEADSPLEGKRFARLMRRVPVGSIPLGSGAFNNVLETPIGDVIRYGPWEDRPAIPGVLQAKSSKRFGTGAQMPGMPPGLALREGLQIEVLPKVEMMSMAMEDSPATDMVINHLSDSLRGHGWDFWDAGARQVGRTKQGEVVVVDAGSLRPRPQPPSVGRSKIRSQHARIHGTRTATGPHPISSRSMRGQT